MSTAGKVLSSSATLLIIRTLQRSLGIISTLVLARLLTPEDFGIVAIAMFVIAFSNIVCMTGAGDFVARADSIDNSVVNTAWTFDILLKSAVALGMLALLPLVHQIWANAVVTLTIAALLPSVLLVSIRNPELLVDARNLSYRRIMRVELIGKLVGFAFTISLAFAMRSHWAIVIGHFIAGLSAVGASWIVCKYKARFELTNLKEQWNFSKWIMGRGGLGFLRAQIDVLFVSKFFPVQQFGAFSLAREISIMPAMDIITPATIPLLATFSKVKDSPAMLKEQLSISLVVIAGVSAPMCLFLGFEAERIVLLLLGEKWINSASLMQAMSPLLFGFSFGAVLNFYLIAKGKYRVLFFYDATSLFLIVCVLTLFLKSNLETLTWARSLVGMILTCGALLFFVREIDLKVVSGLLILLSPIVLALIAYCPLLMLNFDSNWMVLVDGILYVSIYGLLAILTMTICQPYSRTCRLIMTYSASAVRNTLKQKMSWVHNW